ncbi:MAG TPA: hypothetical protein VMF29_08145 [Candidatus Edwardsbacteria bacterium]|nr:hypothetical protein [Candidatus Edwardsbacteria bacterium]
MERVYFKEHNGVQVLVLDLTDSRSIEENMAAFDQAEQLVLRQPERSVRQLTNVTNAHYSTEAVDRMKQYSQKVTPHMRASAAVGISGIKKIVLQSLIRLTGREIRIFDDAAAALDWLAAQ